LGLLFPIYGKIKNDPNHQPVIYDCGNYIVKNMDMTTIYHTCIMETLGFHENLVTFLVVHTLSCSMAKNNL
jgi:hypothetical protein